jgi:hypothetical protein
MARPHRAEGEAMSEQIGDVRHTKHTRVAHRCDWCGEWIQFGEPKASWRWKHDDESMTTVRVHQECYVASIQMDRRDLEDGWTPGQFARGCCCEHGNCECKVSDE